MADKVARLKDNGDKQVAGKEAAAVDTTKADDASNGIMDIADTPDVAVWSKGIRKGAQIPSDRVKEPSKIASTTLHVQEQQSGAGNIWATREEGVGIAVVDPADKEEVAKAVAMGASLTDESGLSKRTPDSSKRKDVSKTG